MQKVWPSKDPEEVLDYSIDWTERLVSETIVTSTWSLTGDDNDLTADSDTISANRTVLWLSGGTLNATYYCTNQIVTSGNRTMEQTVKIKIRAR